MEVRALANDNNMEKSSFSQYVIYQSGAQELSESRFNLLIGATLSWGFLLNYLLVRFATPSLLQVVYAGENRSSAFIGLLVGYFVCVLAGSFLVRRRSTGLAFLGYNLIAIPVGLVASIAVIGYDPTIVVRAVLITAIITCVMMIVSAVFPAAFARMGSGLSVALLAVIIVESLAMLLFRMDLAVLDFVVVGIMSLYIGFDWVRANSVQRTTTNAIAAASALYLDIINIFLRVLRILARSRSRD